MISDNDNENINPPQGTMRFYCSECGTGYEFDPDEEDPTTSSGACKFCGSKKYSIN